LALANRMLKAGCLFWTSRALSAGATSAGAPAHPRLNSDISMPSGTIMSGTMSRSFGRRWLTRFFLALIAVLTVVVAPLAFVIYPTLKSYPETDFPPAKSQAEKNLQDLAHLRRLPEVERSFTDETRGVFMQALDAMERHAAELDRAAFAMGMAKAVASADNGHTNVLGLAGDYGFNAVPFRLGRFADGLFVITAAADHRDLLGAQLLAVNERPTEEIVDELRVYVGGPSNLAAEFSPNFLVSPELLHAAGHAESPDKSEFQVRYKDGTIGTVAFPALSPAHAQLEENFWPKRNLSPLLQENRDWLHVLEGVALPPYLSRPDDNYWHSYPTENVLYVQLNRMGDKGPVSIADYLSGLLDEAKQRNVRNAIVDLRFNRGGDYLLAADFSRRLPVVLPSDGKLVILTSANTFSAAISTAARLKYFAGSRGVLIGEAMGDRGHFWGEGGKTLLPNSKIAVRYTTAYHDWENGCDLSQIRTCFFLNYFYGVPAGSLVPNVAISPTFADYAGGNDPVMAEALRLLGK
jgi:hypothetical protein